MNSPPQHNRPTLRSGIRQAGFSMMEILVALVITLLGLVGIAALQSQLQVSQLEAYQRAHALILLSDIADRLNANRSTLSCFQITTNTTQGTPYIGTAGSGHLDSWSCAADSAAYNTQADNTLTAIDTLLEGAAETKNQQSVGGILGARACISYDAASELIGSGGGALPGTGVYTIAVSWQGMSETFAPTVACANDLYGDEKQRRTVSTTLRIADLDAS